MKTIEAINSKHPITRRVIEENFISTLRHLNIETAKDAIPNPKEAMENIKATMDKLYSKRASNRQNKHIAVNIEKTKL